ncbi:MSMEG_1061 family FMN-dependent PPOX-type flavoprotein [Paenibacillus sp. GCM10023248]|uniref:MSMEG_1061 family FMN-dependent PPOX-type flavoprotein n=1 Tax=unclassified Paenibacillus TaxID=185978 RepID=UPI002379ABCC|nr:MSMEG_1061 family FMN-dependent PPOX-type flavoprotein [Paenibacillus sp. MAHUQ-63]MDD9270571.1 pyridoxamine 5'-phosphate oxidase family protein [Paenibacillus sp. MAHUQ-63]
MSQTSYSGNPPFPGIIQSLEELRPRVGEPHLAVQHKVVSSMDDHIRAFVAKSPLFFLSTSNQSGLCDVSPRGDEPGFVRILDDKRLIYPERLGNRRIDSLQNLLTNPQVGMVFLIPGVETVLRINGRAWLTQDEELLAGMQLNGKQPVVGVGVEVQECFIHCSRALKLARVWQQDTWLPEQEHPDSMSMFRAHVARNGIELKE